MSNLTAVLLGATGGIGQEISTILAKNGFNLILIGRNIKALQQLKQQITQQNVQIQVNCLDCDLSDEQSRKHLIHDLAALEIPLHYYINNAGINDFSLFSEQSPDMIAQMMQINVIYPLQLLQGIIPLMSKTQPTQIIQIGSTFGSIGYPGYASYCASKFALRGAIEALGREYANTKIKFRYFSPRATKTSMNNQKIMQMNAQLGTKMDDPYFVAQEFIHFLKKDCQFYQVGYPEKIFVKINQLIPNLVSSSIYKDLDIIYKNAQHN